MTFSAQDATTAKIILKISQLHLYFLFAAVFSYPDRIFTKLSWQQSIKLVTHKQGRPHEVSHPNGIFFPILAQRQSVKTVIIVSDLYTSITNSV